MLLPMPTWEPNSCLLIICFYKIDETAIDNRLRNGTAHYKYEHKESTQVITYYPFKEGMNRENAQEITFIEFTRKSLPLFREVLNLNHLIKTTLYYCVGIEKDYRCRIG